MIDSKSIAKIWRKLIQTTTEQIGYNCYMLLTFPNLFHVCVQQKRLGTLQLSNLIEVNYNCVKFLIPSCHS
jgi:hypothetical protein